MLALFHYQFFINALLGAVLSSITCGFIGAYIVSRRIVFISGGISHASFGGVGIAYYLGIPPLLGAAVFSMLSAIGIEALSHKSELREDSLIGMMWSFGMAVGIIFIFITPGYAANLMSYLFGSILTISYWEIFLMSALALLILLFFTLLYKEILFVAFDEDYARTQGIPTKIINLVLISLVALTIVINIRVVGIILVISLLTIPQATANLITKNFKLIIIYSAGFAFLASFFGLFLSYQLNIPSGAAIIFISIIIFLLLKGGVHIHTGIKLKKRAG
ncbi:MAG TPA: metal ABC transporter permease [Candidatus Deferrimicrobium sp.]|nr:metal ABC transporter permease [Candidatus Deferrimicrobium sp.]